MVLKTVDHPSSLMTSFLRRCGGCAVIDGGLATELERHGANLNDPLWSAKCLISSPHLIRRVLFFRHTHKHLVFINYTHSFCFII